MRATSFEWTAGDGLPIFVHAFLPDGDVSPSGLVHIAHGMAEHGARYAGLAEALTARGFAVFASDQRGHGRTARTDEDLGFFGSGDGWGRVVSDFRGLLAYTRAQYPGVPQAVLGHSMGSFVTQQLMIDDGSMLRAVVLCSTNGAPPPLARLGVHVARLERARLGERGRSKVLRAMSFDDWNRKFKPNRTDFDWLSRDEAEVDRYAADNRCGFTATTSLWAQLLDALPGLTRADNLARIPTNLPLLIVAGSEDPMHDKTRTLRGLVGAYAEAGMTDLTYRIYTGARHELFHETNRAEVIRDVADWLSSRMR
jgi:alpha-beta hydrolase superfamily lysophospholipase